MRLWRRRETEILLKLVGELLKRVLREEIRERPVIGSWTALLDYLQVALAHGPIEQFRVLFLDRKNILIRDELQQRGTVDHRRCTRARSSNVRSSSAPRRSSWCTTTRAAIRLPRAPTSR